MKLDSRGNVNKSKKLVKDYISTKEIMYLIMYFIRLTFNIFLHTRAVPKLD